MGADKYKKVLFHGKDGTIAIYAGGKKMASALEELLKLDLYAGAKVTGLIEAVYLQGRKEGWRGQRLRSG
jgi:hypothetical protein